MSSSWKPQYQALLKTLGACSEARHAVDESQAQSFEDFWNSVDRPDWMFWLLRRVSKGKKPFVSVAIDIAKSVLPLVPANLKQASQEAIDSAENWILAPTEENRVRAAAAAYAATYAAAAAAYAAAAAAYAAAAAAAYADVAAAYAAAAADVAAAYAAACAKQRKTSCDIIRKHFPASLILTYMEKNVVVQ